MKITNYLPLTLATLAIATGSTALGGMPVPSYQPYSAIPITVSLTLSSQDESDYDYSYNEGVETYAYTTVVNEKRIGNAEILRMIKSDGIIGNISGWKIVAVSGDEEGLMGYYITKTGRQPINIDGYMSDEFEGSGPAAEIYTGTRTESYSESGYSNNTMYSHSLFGAVYIGNSNDAPLFYVANLKYKSLTTYSNYYDGPSELTHSISDFNMLNGVGSDLFGESQLLLTGKIVSTGPSVAIEIYNARQ